MHQLKVLKSSFDFAWIDAIEKTGRRDWYEPLRRRRTPKPIRVLPTASGNALRVSAVPSNVAYSGQSGKHVLDLKFAAFDPKRTSLNEAKRKLRSR